MGNHTDGDHDGGLFLNRDTRRVIRTAVFFLVVMSSAIVLDWCVNHFELIGSYKSSFSTVAFMIVVCDTIYLVVSVIVELLLAIERALLSLGIDLGI